ncbi:FixH family protein [Sphingobacterium wenxiniae]|uniref:FixH protein n=1 Tax=Sphingobacterium wenxiniae TaxID=683125 RepID=A0A1I6V1S2_9SPHI|nr:FixH family protein [Sphingobacterium wenxiniae]SFT07650.1 FixH protein [Sphingobacterium wenxiniae]
MNWGVKIIVGLAAFIIFIVGSGIYMVTKNTDTLEEDDYYEKSLTYDDVYNRKQNLLDDAAKPAIKIQQDTLYILFKSNVNKGELQFKRPSDASLDITLPFATTSRQFQLPVSTFKRGNWKLDINWEGDGKAYLSQHSLFF